MRLFRKKDTPDQTDIVYEKWQTSFSFFQEHRFESETSGAYRAGVESGKMILEISRKNLFAWADNPFYRYDNFLLSADIGFDKSNAYSAVGFLFRRTEDLSYYYFLVSNKGYCRLDLVMNGTPSVIIDWTRCPDFDRSRFGIMISADGSRLSFYLNGDWVGHISDESLSAGGFSFAGQNYDESNNALFYLNRFEIESRPAKLDFKRSRLLRQEIPAASRFAFAESRMRNGSYQAALIELKQVLAAEPENPEALMAAADCCVNLEMYTEASEFLDRTAVEERTGRWYLQKAGVFYLRNDFLGLRDFLRGNIDAAGENAAAYNLLGNAEYSLGNWESASAAYKNAAALDPEQPLFAFNAARALEKVGCSSEAASMYGQSAGLYFRQERYAELEGILPFLEKLDKGNPETAVLKAKLMFHNEEFDAAGKIFSKLISDKTADSTVYYLDALIQVRAGKPRKASSSFKKAVSLEPDYYLYPFKYAEYLFLSGGDYAPQLERALELAPDDPWILNLAGQAAAAEGRYRPAAAYYEKALTGGFADDVIRVNYSETLFLDGRPDEALAMLDFEGADSANQRGNILARLGRYLDAVAEYEAALGAEPNRTDIMLNLAAACIESDAFVRAEELLIKVLEAEENAQAYNLTGNLAMLKGEYGRAEAAFVKALETEPRFADAACNLAELLIKRERLNDADMMLQGLDPGVVSERLEKLRNTVFWLRMNVFSCGGCDAEWTVPRKIAAQPALKLVGEPPDAMPAGKCPSCGAVFCIGCVKEHLENGRLVCLECGAPLKLSEDWMRYIYHEEGF